MKGISTIWDNDPPYRWKGWIMPEFPDELAGEKNNFMDYLTGLAPVAKRMKDRCGWGGSSGRYTSAHGYKVYSTITNVANNPSIWKNLWESITLPKIDVFCWTLAHGKVLIGENLEMRGIVGPFR